MNFEFRISNEEPRRRRSRLRHSTFDIRNSKFLLPLFSAAIVIAIWSIAVHLTATKIFPSPAAVAKGIAQLAQRGQLWSYVVDSLARVAAGYLGAIGIRTKLRTMERAAYFSALESKKLKGVCFCGAGATYGNASTRMSVIVPSDGIYAYGGWPDVDELYKKQLTETDPERREVTLHEIQKILHERTRFAPIWDYFWPSGIGPRVEDAALMKIDPYPWSAPLEDVKLKKP